MSITDIAFSSGYNSRQHFAHTFEKYYGTGPLSYRKLHKRQMAADTGKKQYILEDGRTSYQKLIE
jgi:AraC-like DNA-binding protein